MLSFSEKFPGWKDFPKGLHVLVVDESPEVLTDVQKRLESFSYVVSSFSNGQDALDALHREENSFHVALLEATSGNGFDVFKILEATRHLPTVMMSNTENMAIMMKSIAAGASEFLQKPLSDEKLKNIWQHVVRKALCGGEIAFPAYVRQAMASKPLSEPLSLAEPARVEPLLSVKIEPKTEELRPTDLFSKEMSDCSDPDRKSDIIGDSFLSVERLAAPATPQLEQMGRFFSKEDALLDESNVSGDPSHVKAELDIPPEEYRICDHFLQVKTEIDDMLDTSSTLCGLFDMKIRDSVLKSDDIESLKSELSTEIPFDDSLDDISLSGDLVIDGDVLSGIDMDPSILDGLNVSESLDISIDCLGDGEIQEAESVDEEALLLAEVEKAEIAGIVRRDYLQNALQLSTVVAKEARGSSKKSKKRDFEYVASGTKNGQGKRKMKVDWTPDLHRRFVQAVEQLGVDKAIPSRILELMGVQCLTRHNIASHLQKYRSHRKHLLAREAEAANWNNRRNLDAVSWGRTRRDGSSLLPSHHHSNNPPPIQPRPAIGLAPIQPHPLAPPLHVWGHPTVDHSPIHMWPKQPVAAAAWQAADGTFWQQSAACLDAWGHPAPAPGTPCYPPPPMMRLPLAPMPGVANMAVPAIPGGGVSENGDAFGCGKGASFHPLKETVDAAINEVLNNPWIPLPLGLKPPSLESVVAELQRQGITAVPPASS